MIVLDTNVISELFKPQPNARVVKWMEDQPGTVLFTTAITRGELLYGLHCMPDGQRRAFLLQGLIRLFDDRLAGRVLAYDGEAADDHALIAAEQRALGRPVGQSDARLARSRQCVRACRGALVVRVRSSTSRPSRRTGGNGSADVFVGYGSNAGGDAGVPGGSLRLRVEDQHPALLGAPTSSSAFEPSGTPTSSSAMEAMPAGTPALPEGV